MREHVNQFIGQLPLTRLPSSMDAMRLLDRLALEGIRFPSGLMMFRKVLFTLDGILHDIAAPQADYTLPKRTSSPICPPSLGSAPFPVSTVDVRKPLL